MKLFNRILLLMALFWGLSGPTAKAAHMLGADLTWSCNSTNPCLYTFTYTYYEDCPNNIPVAGPTLYFDCPGQNSTSPFPTGSWIIRNPGGTDITPLCPGQVSDCNGGTIPGVQQHILTRTYNFCQASMCPLWSVDWGICCRSNQITTLQNGANTGMYTSSSLSYTPNNCNSSPRFNSAPIAYICNGQTTSYSMGANDPDGDQLTYSLISCTGTGANPLTYLPGFGPTNPLGPNWNVTLDPNTGNITFANTSPDIQVAVMCVKVDEFRNGQLIGSVIRDIEVRVIPCSNNLPTLSGLDGSTDFATKACAGVNTCFFVNSHDLDPADNLTVTLVSGPPGMTITTVGSPHPVATVCWTPTPGDIGANTFVLEVRDDACPLEGVQQYTYSIEVDVCNPCDTLNINLSWTHTQSLLDIVVNNTTTGSPIDFTEYIWGDGSSNVIFPGNHTSPVSHTFPAAGTYTVCVKTYTYIDDICCHDSLCKQITVTDNPCDEHVADWNAFAEFQNPCNFYFYDATTPGSSTVYWDFGSGPLVSGSPAIHSFPGSGTYTVTMYSTYHPPSNPQLCCYDSYTSTVVVNCEIKDRGTWSGGKMAWNENTSTLEVLINKEKTQESSHVSIYDLSGKLLLEKANVRRSGASFDLSGFASGIYLIRTVTGEKVETRKFAKP